MSETFNYCHVVGKTDVGLKRAANEDNMLNAITQNGLVSIVCDGMGGHVGGATASKIAVTTIIENLNNVYYEDPRIAIGESIDRANRAIIQKTKEQPDLSGMGSTCVMLLVRNGKVYIGHVGDSRIYLVRNKKIVQLTKDHSYVQMLVDCGEITKEQAEHHPRKNEITNALGIPNMSPATIAENAISPEAGDCFVLCSDGLSGMISDSTICKVVSRQSEMNAQNRADRLVTLANENGGLDNITVQLVEFSVTPDSISERKKFPTWAKISCAISIMASLIVSICFLLKNQPVIIDDVVVEEVNDTIIKLGDITYKNDGQIVELVFSGSYLELKRNNERLHIVENVSFDATTLHIETSYIEPRYNNSLLEFTDKYPGNKVEFSITTSDKQKVYRFIFNVNKSGNKPSDPYNIKKPEIKQPTPIVKSADEESNDVVDVKIDTIPFEYGKLEKGAKLLFNYSANPIISLKRSIVVGEEDVQEQEQILHGYKIDKIVDYYYEDDNMSLYWDVKNEKPFLSFTYKDNNPSQKTHKFVILCKLKDSEKHLKIFVDLVPKAKEDVLDDNTKVESYNESKKNDTKCYELKYNKLAEDSIVFNYVGIPYVLYNGNFIVTNGSEIDSIGAFSCSDNLSVEHYEDDRQLVIKFKGESLGLQQEQIIEIPFYAEGTNDIIYIKLLPANNEDAKDAVPSNEGNGIDNSELEKVHSED